MTANWLNIETAPKRRVIGYDSKRGLIYTMYWGSMERKTGMGWVAEGAPLSEFDPTHWVEMPLPFSKDLSYLDVAGHV